MLLFTTLYSLIYTDSSEFLESVPEVCGTKSPDSSLFVLEKQQEWVRNPHAKNFDCHESEKCHWLNTSLRNTNMEVQYILALLFVEVPKFWEISKKPRQLILFMTDHDSKVIGIVLQRVNAVKFLES